MSQLTQEELNKKIMGLPQDLRDTFYSAEITEAMQGLAKKHGLTLDKMGLMYEKVNDVILGLAHPKDFIKNLSDSLEIDPQKAKDIAQDINVAIFKPIRESLKKVHNITDAEMPKAEPPKVPPAMRMRPGIMDHVSTNKNPVSEIKTQEMSGKETPKQDTTVTIRPAPTLSTKPHPDLQKPSVGQELREPIEKPTATLPQGGSFKAGIYAMPGIKVPSIQGNLPKAKTDLPQAEAPKPSFWKKSFGVTKEKIKKPVETVKPPEPSSAWPEPPKPEPTKPSPASVPISPEPVKPPATAAAPQPKTSPSVNPAESQANKPPSSKSSVDLYREPIE